MLMLELLRFRSDECDLLERVREFQNHLPGESIDALF
jgi:hypothetical protein